MDALALLCNLHADGPATLQRLRRSGCESLVGLRRIDPATLAEWLDWNERTAERFLREAALLCERVEESDAGLEPAESQEFELESTLAAEFEDDEEETELEEEPSERVEEEEVADLAASERVEVVLGAWRELDRVSPPGEPSEFVIPRPAAVPDRNLSQVALQGLSGDLVARLAGLGLHTLTDLARADGLRLARALSLGFTRTRHLQHLASRELERLASTAAVDPQPVRGFDVFAPPPSEPFETAGPFA